MTHDPSPNIAIGIDVGGTAIKGGVVARSGEVLSKGSATTEVSGGVDHVIERIAELIRELASSIPNDGDSAELGPRVGLGVPGNIDHDRGIVLASPNLHGWRNVPIREALARASGLDIYVDNDANNAALGEFHAGAGRGVRNLALLTLGTGIGCGLILDGKLWRGAQGNAGEIGHTIVQVDGRLCACGQPGCLEAYASATSVAQRAADLIRDGAASSLKEIADRGDSITSEAVVAAFRNGDSLAGEVWQEFCRYLAAACINIHHLLNPDCIVLGGGMSAAGEHLREPLSRAIEKMHSTQFHPAPIVRIAELGNDAGLIGAAQSALRVE